MRHSELLHNSQKDVIRFVVQAHHFNGVDRTDRDAARFGALANAVGHLATEVGYLADMVKDVYDQLDRVEKRLGPY